MVGSVYFARLINLAAYVLLLRRVAPVEVGQISFAIAILMVVTSLKRFGLHVALLHRYDEVERLETTHFLLNSGLAILGAMAAIATAFIYGAIGEANPIVVNALIIFAVLDMVRSLVQTSETRLRQQLQFGRLALAHASATVAASVVAVAVAYLGGGTWALILGFSINSVTYVLIYCALIWQQRPPLLPRLQEWDRAGARDLLRYGVWFWAAGIMQTLTLHFDRLVVGMMLGDDLLGIYAAAHIFAQIPTGAVTHMIQGVTGTVYARYQQDRKLLSSAFYRTQRLIIRCTVPITLILALEAPILVGLIKAEWLPLVPVLRWLILYSLCRPALDDVYFLLYGVGQPRWITRFVSFQALSLLALAPLMTSHYGLEGAALGMDVAALIGLLFAMRAVRAHVDISWKRVFGAPLVAGLVASALRLAADDPLSALSPIFALVAGAAILATGYAATLILLERRELAVELRSLWNALTDAGRANADRATSAASSAERK
jgi:O-antigen/teichoic acid export membrane protein